MSTVSGPPPKADDPPYAANILRDAGVVPNTRLYVERYLGSSRGKRWKAYYVDLFSCPESAQPRYGCAWPPMEPGGEPRMLLLGHIYKWRDHSAIPVYLELQWDSGIWEAPRMSIRSGWLWDVSDGDLLAMKKAAEFWVGLRLSRARARVWVDDEMARRELRQARKSIIDDENGEPLTARAIYRRLGLARATYYENLGHMGIDSRDVIEGRI